MGINDDESIFLTQEEQDLFLLTQTELDSKEWYEYKQGFENAIMEVQYGMLLSRSWGEKIQGTLQMDMIFATIPVFG